MVMKNKLLVNLLESVTPLAQDVTPPVRYLKSWIYENRVLVLDYEVSGMSIAFDTSFDEIGDSLRVEIVFRNFVDKNTLEKLNIKKISGRRFLVAVLPNSKEETSLANELFGCCSLMLSRIVSDGVGDHSSLLIELLDLEERIVIADVGANPMSPPPYQTLIHLNLCKVIGFEPQPDAYEALLGRDPQKEIYYPYAIGKPGKCSLNIYAGSGFTSTYEVDSATVDFLGDPNIVRGTKVREVIDLECHALDHIAGIDTIDVLKIDIQGGEVDVFRNAKDLLSKSICVITEVAFFPFYRDAPSFADIHLELTRQGFQLHKFSAIKDVHLYGRHSEVDGVISYRSQILDGDAIYLKDLRFIDSLQVDQVKKLALLAHFVFDSSDLCLYLIDHLQKRGAVNPEKANLYAKALVR